MDYNTSRGALQMREYGRHVQQMVAHLMKIEDDAIRQQNAEAIVELMGFLNPSIKVNEDFRHQLWDHLFAMSNFELEVESPYPRPTPESYMSKPERLPYPKHRLKYNHLGKNLQQLIEKAMAEKDEDKQSGFAHTIAHYMKLAYSTWHKELMHDDAIRQELDAITDGQLTFSSTPFVRHRVTQPVDESSYGSRRNNKFKQKRRSNNNNNKNRRYSKKRF